MSLTVIAVKSKLKDGKFDLFNAILESLKSKIKLNNGDILVVSSKYVSNAQGRVLDYKDVIPTTKAKKIATQYEMDPIVTEVIVRESDVVFGGVPGFIITSSDSVLAPNAGIDKSNAKKGKLILYPNDPQSVAEEIKRKFFLKFSIHIGVIITDSRLMPTRIGTIGVALACVGIEPTSDLRAKKDLYKKPLKVTFQAVADNLASVANFKMGEGSEATPIVVIKNAGVKLTDRKISVQEMAISHEQCVYVRGLSSRQRS